MIQVEKIPAGILEQFRRHLQQSDKRVGNTKRYQQSKAQHVLFQLLQSKFSKTAFKNSDRNSDRKSKTTSALPFFKLFTSLKRNLSLALV